MYTYKIGYYSYEECPNITLISSIFYTEEDFKKLVTDISMDFVGTKKYTDKFEDLYKFVASALIDKYNFVELKHNGQFIPFGWASIKNPKDWPECEANIKRNNY
jgi:hypothetical protein